MTLLVYVLVTAAAAVSFASRSSLILKEDTIPLEVKNPLELDCGIEGNYRHCFWKTGDGHFFQVEDVHAGLHDGLRAPHNLTNNQCGIVVEKSTAKHSGEWTCHVLLTGDVLKGVRTVTRACTPPFQSVGTGCFYFSELLTMNWKDARGFCKSLSPEADLAVLDDCHLFQLVWSHILVNYEPSSHWIGGTDEHLDGRFYWVDGTSMVLGTPFWYPGQPNGQACVYMSSPYGYFNDYGCSTKLHFLCQLL